MGTVYVQSPLTRVWRQRADFVLDLQVVGLDSPGLLFVTPGPLVVS